MLRDGITDYAEACRLRDAVAELAADYPDALPIFERLDRLASDLKEGRHITLRARRFAERRRDMAALI